MKYLVLVPLVFVAACASRPQVAVRPIPPPAIEPIDAVRYAEVVTAYQVGRYVDPNRPETMHERHPVYRVEANAHWNLHPSALNTVGSLTPPPDAAFSPVRTNDILAAEMNRQREITAQVMKEAAKLAQSYGELQSVLGEMMKVTRSTALLNARLATNEQRVAEFSKELQKLSATPPLATNDAPAFTPEPSNTAKP